MKKYKFKIGQKVRVIKWLNMPQDMVDIWGRNMHIGEMGVIIGDEPIVRPDAGYNIRRKDKDYSFFCFEGELELFIKVGEQLEFNFMKEDLTKG